MLQKKNIQPEFFECVHQSEIRVVKLYLSSRRQHNYVGRVSSLATVPNPYCYATVWHCHSPNTKAKGYAQYENGMVRTLLLLFHYNTVILESNGLLAKAQPEHAERPHDDAKHRTIIIVSAPV